MRTYIEVTPPRPYAMQMKHYAPMIVADWMRNGNATMKAMTLIPNPYDFKRAVRRGEADPQDANKSEVFTYDRIRSIVIMK